MSALTAILGNTVKGKDGEDIDVASFFKEDTFVGLYFSAHWCPPCRQFTPKLAEYYTKLKDSGKKFEIVFISSDRDQKSFDNYYSSMPWLALAFEERERKEKLGTKYGVSGIPCLVLLDSEGNSITKDGRTKVVADADGTAFPWK